MPKLESSKYTVLPKIMNGLDFLARTNFREYSKLTSVRTAVSVSSASHKWQNIFEESFCSTFFCHGMCLCELSKK